MPRLLVLNGTNLNMLGKREPHQYGSDTLADVERLVEKRATKLGYAAEFFQSNHERALVDKLHENRGVADGAIVNAGALATSTAPAGRTARGRTARRRSPRREYPQARDVPPLSYLSDITEAIFIGAGIHGYVYIVETLHRALTEQP